MTHRPMPRRNAYCDPLSMSQDGSGDGTPLTDPPPGTIPNVVTSLMPDGLHAPVLDIDFPAFVVPSSTPGHFHLYLDKPIEWDAYEALLKALCRAGVLSFHYTEHSIQREQTVVRMPWVDKDPTPGPHAAPSVAALPDTKEPF